MDGGERALAICMAVALAAAAVMYGGAAHAAQEGGAIPEWIKTVFGYYATGEITDAEIIGALQYLIGAGVITLPAEAPPEAAAAAAAPANMSPEAADLMEQAEVAECLAAEQRQQAAAWKLDLKQTRHMPAKYHVGVQTAIDASAEGSRAADAWAAAVRQAALDGTITARERSKILMAEDDMAAAAAGFSEAFENTMAGQLFIELDRVTPGMTDAYIQAATLSGAATDCW